MAVVEGCFSKGIWESLLLVPSAYAVAAAGGDNASDISPEPMVRS